MDKSAILDENMWVDLPKLGRKVWSGVKTVGSVPLKLISMSTPKWMYPLAAMAAASPLVVYELNKRIKKHKIQPQIPIDVTKEASVSEFHMQKAAAAIDAAIRGQAMRDEVNRPDPTTAVNGIDDFKKMLQAAKTRALNRSQRNTEVSSSGLRPTGQNTGGLQRVTELQQYTSR